MQVELHISCKELKNLDMFSKSDPQVVFYKQDEKRKGKWILAGKTEVITDNLNPTFEKYFTVAYTFEKHQKMRFEVLDIDIAGTTEFIGYIETSMGQVMGARNQTFIAELKHDKKKGKRGQILIQAEALKETNHNVIY